jgi:hypothetical protein
VERKQRRREIPSIASKTIDLAGYHEDEIDGSAPTEKVHLSYGFAKEDREVEEDL